jgi:hypothetical protein
MSRDINGNYTLPPVVNPVVAATTITVTWANSTLTDVAAALTDSLSRSGAGGMTAPLRLIDGTAVAPALSFSAESTTGLYRIGSNSVGLSLSGTPQYRFNVGAMDIWNGSAWEAVATISTIVNKNRLANGAFVFDQRNNGIPPTINSGAEFRCQDCWTAFGRTSGGAFTVTQQATGGPLLRSPNYSRVQVSIIDTPIPGTGYIYRALVEGLDIADLGFGASGAKPVSVSFWFRSSLTGTFSGSIYNAPLADRSYAYSWVYSVANVWQKVEIANIPGDVAGTWPNNNSRSLFVNFCIGAAASLLGSAGSWQAATLLGVTGSPNVMATPNATYDIAQVQLEAGTACTPFEWTPYQAGLARVRRYFRAYRAVSNDGVSFSWAGYVGIGAGVWATAHFDPPMRTTPTTDLTPATFSFVGLGTPTVASNSSTAVVLQYVGTLTGNASAILTAGQITVSAEL